jgi:hypothetical protein
LLDVPVLEGPKGADGWRRYAPQQDRQLPMPRGGYVVLDLNASSVIVTMYSEPNAGSDFSG